MKIEFSFARYFFARLRLIIALAFVLAASLGRAEQIQNTNTAVSTYTVTQRGPNSRTWTHTNNAVGASSAVRHQVTELETGMHHWNGQQWVLSNPGFDATTNGFAATNTQHQVYLNQDLSVAGAVHVITRDGVVLNSTPLGIGLYDAASGNFTLIGQVTNSTAIQIASNQVAYPNAFSGVCADVVYTMERGSFHQDIVFTGQVNPATYGFPPSTTRIQILTEFYNPPTPEMRQSVLRRETNQVARTNMASPDLLDQTLGFGEFVMGRGRAYLNQTNTSATNRFTQSVASVGKVFLSVNNRRLLVESVDYTSASNQLQALPNCNGSGSTSKLNIRKADAAYALLPSLPSVLSASLKSKSKTRASLTPPILSRTRAEFVMDYVATVGGTMDDAFTFQGDTTYFIDGYFTCNGNVTLEGGAVLKYPAMVLDGSLFVTSGFISVGA